MQTDSLQIVARRMALICRLLLPLPPDKVDSVLIPTEPIGSIPRPLELIDGLSRYESDDPKPAIAEDFIRLLMVWRRNRTMADVVLHEKRGSVTGGLTIGSASQGAPVMFQLKGHQPPSVHQEDFTILVVDDESAIVDLATSILNAAGFSAFGTTDPDEALQRIETDSSIKVLVSDVMMPKATGPEVVRRAQRVRRGGLRVLFMTGGFDGVRLRHTDRILEKPWSSEELISAIRRILSDEPQQRVVWDGPERRKPAA